MSCKKDSDIQDNIQSNFFGDLIANPTASDIQNHIIWIAKGLPFLAKNNHFRYSVEESVMASPLFEAANSTVHSDAWNNYSYHYQDSLHSTLDNKFPLNTYDPDHFAGFTYNNCDWYFKIRIPEMDEQDTSMPHIVIPHLILQSDTNVFYKAFFINTGLLDSLTLSVEDFENYYIWVVSAEDDCPVSAPNIGCNGDSICQPDLGENADNCEDCIGTNVEVDKMGKLILKGIISKRDWKKDTNWPLDRFEEDWLKNKYEIAISWAVVSDNHLEASSVQVWTKNLNNADDIPFEQKLTAWGNNCDVKRSKKITGGSKSNRGVENSYKSVNAVLDENFNFDLDSLYFNYYELDKIIGPVKNTIITHLGNNKTFSFNSRSFRDIFSSSVILNGSAQHVVDAPAYIEEWVKIVVPPSSNSPYINGWNVVGQQNGRDILECTVECDEFSFVLRLEPTH